MGIAPSDSVDDQIKKWTPNKESHRAWQEVTYNEGAETPQSSTEEPVAQEEAMEEIRTNKERFGPGAVGMEISHMKTCARCGSRYDWRKSQSSTLKMTYCSSLCEKGDLGFTIDALLAFEPKVKEPAEEEAATTA